VTPLEIWPHYAKKFPRVYLLLRTWREWGFTSVIFHCSLAKLFSQLLVFSVTWFDEFYQPSVSGIFPTSCHNRQDIVCNVDSVLKTMTISSHIIIKKIDFQDKDWCVKIHLATVAYLYFCKSWATRREIIQFTRTNQGLTAAADWPAPTGLQHRS
jgi:hypothetical protein